MPSGRASRENHAIDVPRGTNDDAMMQTITLTRRNSKAEPVAADSNSLPTWRRRRRPRDCRRYDARRRSIRRHLTGRRPTVFTAANAPLFKKSLPNRIAILPRGVIDFGKRKMNR